MFNTFKEIDAAIHEINLQYKKQIYPYEQMYTELYEKLMAEATTLDEQWKVYTECPSRYLHPSYSFSANSHEFCIDDYIVHYDVFDNEIKEPFEYCLHHWIEYDNEYISHGKIVEFFADEPIEIETRSDITGKYIVVKVPEHILTQWKQTLIDTKAANIYHCRESW